MMFRVVPTYISDEINTKLDAAFADQPDAEEDREVFYAMLLDYVDEHGFVPDFQLVKQLDPPPESTSPRSADTPRFGCGAPMKASPQRNSGRNN